MEHGFKCKAWANTEDTVDSLRFACQLANTKGKPVKMKKISLNWINGFIKMKKKCFYFMKGSVRKMKCYIKGKE